ncbi:unnamed protein product [Pleuronectes platessa]|uniref:BCL2 binding component 3 n=1 Tax=Pleuronectes platessa TaxID=8262 RepID=A0A9N7UBS0_PLEPL|nr:unnamed protein product [Pleuronectes platessa]
MIRRSAQSHTCRQPRSITPTQQTVKWPEQRPLRAWGKPEQEETALFHITTSAAWSCLAPSTPGPACSPPTPQTLVLALPQMHQQLPALSPSSAPPSLQLCNRREERDGGAVKPCALSGEESDTDIEEHREASSQQGPLPDLLPRNELPSWSASYHRDPRREAEQELEVRRVANQLRAIGDQYNATVLRRAHAAPHWQDWRDVCRGLFNFITQSLSALYRLTSIAGRRRVLFDCGAKHRVNLSPNLKRFSSSDEVPSCSELRPSVHHQDISVFSVT